jgi:hypothetical protein
MKRWRQIRATSTTARIAEQVFLATDTTKLTQSMGLPTPQTIYNRSDRTTWQPIAAKHGAATPGWRVASAPVPPGKQVRRRTPGELAPWGYGYSPTKAVSNR